ncbi:unnamed protein product, partial [Ectocarpus sp. 12 AP-2014]
MELCVLDTRAGTELEHASLSTLSSTSLPSPPLPPGTYHNAFRACEGRLYLLGRQELRAVRVQGWSQRVESLVQAGEWLEALAVALDHFEQKILPAENAAAAAAAATQSAGGGGGSGTSAHRAGGATGGALHRSGSSRDIRGGAGRMAANFGGEMLKSSSSHGGGLWPGVAGGGSQQRRPAPRSEAAEHISDLLAQYLRLAMNNAPAADSSSLHSTAAAAGKGGGGGGAGSPGGPRINLAHSHFQMLAGVCAEFCAVTGRLDMLFGQIFQAFRARGQQGVFLDTLEPYVLMGKLKTLSPEVISAFIDRRQSAGDMIAAERLVLRLEPRSLELETTLPLLRGHRLYSALLAVGALTGDHVSSAEEVLREAMSIAERDRLRAPHPPSSGDGGERGEGDRQQQLLHPYPADPTFDELGYKVLLYLKRCFRGRVLGASEPLSAVDTAKARASLLHLLVRPALMQSSSSSIGAAGVAAVDGGGRRAGGSSKPWAGDRRWQEAFFPYLAVLLYVDAGATIDVLAVAMDSPDATFRREVPAAAAAAATATAAGAASLSGDGSGLAVAVPPTLHRELSSSSSSFAAASDVARGGGPTGGEATGSGGGGVWGRRLGRRGRAARAVGWAAGAPVAAGGPEARTKGVEGGEGDGVWGGTAAAVEAENLCPSRRSVVEAVTSVLAPHLSDQAEQLEAASSSSGAPSSEGPGSSNGGGLSAAAFVHGAQPPEKATVAAKKDEEGYGDDGLTAEAAAQQSSLLRDRDGQEWWAAARPHLFGFVAKYLELSLVSVGPRLTNAVLVSVATGSGGGGGGGGGGGHEGPDPAVDAQARLVTLLERVPLSLVDRDRLLPLAEKSGFFRAAVILLKAAVTLGEQRGFTLEQFARIVRCYLQDSEDAFRSQVFGFIRQEIARAATAAAPSSGNASSKPRQAKHGDGSPPGTHWGGGEGEAELLSEKRDVVLEKLPQLMELDKAEAVFTVGEAFGGDHKAALAALSATTTLQFDYLDALLRPPSEQQQQGVSSSPSPPGSGGADIARGGSGWGGGQQGVRHHHHHRGDDRLGVGGVRGPGSRPSSGLAAGLDDGDRSLHVRLLVRFRPYEVYPFLSSSTGYSLDDTLALCQERGVADATAYLLERKGDVPGALALALRTLSARLASLRTALQTASLRELAAEMALLSSSSTA